MMRLPRFSYFAPRSLSEAVTQLADCATEAALVAGGTDLFPNMKRRQMTPKKIIGLRQVSELHGIEQAKEIRIGAMTSLSEIDSSPIVGAAWPALAVAASLISTPPLRNMGTLGGNLCLDTRCNYYDQNYEWRKAIDFCMKKDGQVCWVAPGSERCWAVQSSDTAPLLCALGAQVTLVSRQGERRIAVSDLFHDDGIQYLTKRPDEILAAIYLPVQDGHSKAVYKKLRRRGAFDFPVLGVGAMVGLAKDGETVERASIYIGGTGSRPHFARSASEKLIGQSIGNQEVRREVAELAAKVAKPLDNTDYVMGWRKEMAQKFVAQALAELAA